ncbi:MAG TPA: arginase family protein [Pseudonocardiaceae bacterium]|jgi:arginase|nr:arginase family protein [Pseudonocardiaceae bacterium]
MEIHSVPQHQGALGATAVQLSSGGRALAKLAGEVLGVDVRPVPVAEHGSATVDGVANRDVLLANRAEQLAALLPARGPVLTVGGDCGVELAPLRHARERFGRTLGVAWFDAHADLNTPETSPSGAFHGMVLRAAMGGGDTALAADPRIGRGRAALFGARALDRGEWPLVWQGHVRHLPVHAARRSVMVSSSVLEMDPDEVYLHIGLDVLDPAEFAGTNCPEPDGLRVAEVAAAVRAIAEAAPVIGAGITECVTDDPEELRLLVPLLEAVGQALTG